MRALLLAACLSLGIGGCGDAATEAVPPTEVPGAPVQEPAAAEPEVPSQPVVWILEETAHPALTDPGRATVQAPEQYKVRFLTTKGDIVVQVHRAWAPLGADRFYNLVDIGFFDKASFFRAVKGFMVQFGVSGYPQATRAWSDATIDDDPVLQSNKRGTLTFAKPRAPNSRSTQLFINLKDNPKLDQQGFAPFAEVIEGMDVVDSLYTGYGDAAPRGRGPDQGRLKREGGTYLAKFFPELDGISQATIVDPPKAD